MNVSIYLKFKPQIQSYHFFALNDLVTANTINVKSKIQLLSRQQTSERTSFPLV